MKVSLAEDTAQFVQTEVDSGRYDSAQDVVREALHLLYERTLVENDRRAHIDQQLAKGLDQLDRGEGIPGDVAFKALWERSRRRREAR